MLFFLFRILLRRNWLYFDLNRFIWNWEFLSQNVTLTDLNRFHSLLHNLYLAVIASFIHCRHVFVFLDFLNSQFTPRFEQMLLYKLCWPCAMFFLYFLALILWKENKGRKRAFWFSSAHWFCHAIITFLFWYIIGTKVWFVFTRLLFLFLLIFKALHVLYLPYIFCCLCILVIDFFVLSLILFCFLFDLIFAPSKRNTVFMLDQILFLWFLRHVCFIDNFY